MNTDSTIKRSLDLKRTALAVFRASCADDDAGAAALLAGIAPADEPAVGHAINEVAAGALSLPAGITLDAFLDAYGLAIDRTERKLTGRG
ncbi:hypothetical protein D6T63_05665 [Arthrobacter cheniae]|uniref:Uncharacterized protein n=1 Tax=Arthrobacter cheniae TaxID=1258888 RepID=A0A3A5MH06_9MICC|nr:hypothetical protein [Arthrobacter cheniae]RJT82208.1 hypothetical protein D6T63_05665 [Arthrobacter cheniae]